MKEIKLVKVVMKYDNGDTKYLIGEELGKWDKACSAASTFMYCHGGETGFENIKWKTIKFSRSKKNGGTKKCS